MNLSNFLLAAALAATAFFVPSPAEAKPDGSPKCLVNPSVFLKVHKNFQQPDIFPGTLKVQSATYDPQGTDPIVIEIATKDQQPWKGLLLYVAEGSPVTFSETNGDTRARHAGTFIRLDPSFKPMEESICASEPVSVINDTPQKDGSREASTITHASEADKATVKFYWMPPKNGIGAMTITGMMALGGPGKPWGVLPQVTLTPKTGPANGGVAQPELDTKPAPEPSVLLGPSAMPMVRPVNPPALPPIETPKVSSSVPSPADYSSSSEATDSMPIGPATGPFPAPPCEDNVQSQSTKPGCQAVNCPKTKLRWVSDQMALDMVGYLLTKLKGKCKDPLSFPPSEPRTDTRTAPDLSTSDSALVSPNPSPAPVIEPPALNGEPSPMVPGTPGPNVAEESQVSTSASSGSPSPSPPIVLPGTPKPVVAAPEVPQLSSSAGAIGGSPPVSVEPVGPPAIADKPPMVLPGTPRPVVAAPEGPQLSGSASSAGASPPVSVDPVEPPTIVDEPAIVLPGTPRPVVAAPEGPQLSASAGLTGASPPVAVDPVEPAIVLPGTPKPVVEAPKESTTGPFPDGQNVEQELTRRSLSMHQGLRKLTFGAHEGLGGLTGHLQAKLETGLFGSNTGRQQEYQSGGTVSTDGNARDTAQTSTLTSLALGRDVGHSAYTQTTTGVANPPVVERENFVTPVKPVSAGIGAGTLTGSSSVTKESNVEAMSTAAAPSPVVATGDYSGECESSCEQVEHKCETGGSWVTEEDALDIVEHLLKVMKLGRLRRVKTSGGSGTTAPTPAPTPGATGSSITTSTSINTPNSKTSGAFASASSNGVTVTASSEPQKEDDYKTRARRQLRERIVALLDGLDD